MFPPEHNAGSETTLLAMFRGLSQRGHETRVISVESTKDHYVVDGVEVFRPPATERNRGPWYLDLYNWCDIAVTHLNCTGHAMHCARETSRPLVHLVHNNDQLRFHNVKSARAQLLIFNSQWLRDAYGAVNAPHIPLNPSIVMHPIVDPEKYRVENRDGAEAVAFVNLTVTKGALVFYELAKRFPDIPFYGVRGAYGDEHKPPEDLPNLKIFDQMPDLRPVWKKTRVVLMPSDYESYGRVAVEAACSGIPAIVHPTPGLRESLGTSGIFVDRNNVDAWETELSRLYNDDIYYQERSKMALELSERLRPEESIDRVEKCLEIVLRHGLDKSAWTVEALGEEAYVKKALDGGYFDPRREPKGFRPPLSRNTFSGPPFTSDRRIWLDSNGNPVDQSSKDKQVLYMGANATLSFEHAVAVGIVDQGGVPFYDPAFRGRVPEEEAAKITERKPDIPIYTIPQVVF